MRVIEHGDQWEIAERVCKECKCKFAYNRRDIKTEKRRDEDGDYEEVTLVYCPECRNEVRV